MPEPIDVLLRRANESLQTSGERIIAAEESERQSDSYVSASREAIDRSNQQLARLRGRT